MGSMTAAGPDPILTILDVGHGNCAVLEHEGRAIVFDCGPKTGLLEYLSSRAINTLDLVLISHADEDHIAGLIAVLASGLFQVKCVRLNTDSLKGSAIWDDLAAELSSLQQSGALDFRPSLTDADNGAFDASGIQIEVMAPTTYLATKGPGSRDYFNRKISTNSISAVVRIHFDGQPVVLLAGDMDTISLEEMERAGRKFGALNLVFPHHGGRGAANMADFAQKLFDLVSPKQVFFSIGRGLHGTPLPEVIERAKSQDGLYIACTQLSKHCAAADPGGTATHIGTAFAVGRDKNHSCAGSVVISLKTGGMIEPQQEAHQNFISVAALTALCRK
jgi:beta-lactamase superfamily II metal-dependent hydrolase